MLLGNQGEDHLLISFDEEHSFDANGKMIDSIRPVGMSGGALFDLGNVADPSSLEEQATSHIRLVGVMTKHKADHKIMMATHTSAVLYAYTQMNESAGAQ